MSDLELKPCPFCGGEAEMMGDQYPYVECSSCSVNFSADHSYEFDFENAAGKWNARLESEVERLRGRCGELESQPTVTQLSELMRGLQVGPGFSTMPPYMFYVIGKKIADQASEATDAAILRKQAEAVEACEQEFQGQLGVIMTLSQYAQRLRQQADDLEADNV